MCNAWTEFLAMCSTIHKAAAGVWSICTEHGALIITILTLKLYNTTKLQMQVFLFKFAI